jgi:hypothetical protein
MNLNWRHFFFRIEGGKRQKQRKKRVPVNGQFSENVGQYTQSTNVRSSDLNLVAGCVFFFLYFEVERKSTCALLFSCMKSSGQSNKQKEKNHKKIEFQLNYDERSLAETGDGLMGRWRSRKWGDCRV